MREAFHRPSGLSMVTRQSSIGFPWGNQQRATSNQQRATSNEQQEPSKPVTSNLEDQQSRILPDLRFAPTMGEYPATPTRGQASEVSKNPTNSINPINSKNDYPVPSNQ
jgi:hypothetical protein